MEGFGNVRTLHAFPGNGAPVDDASSPVVPLYISMRYSERIQQRGQGVKNVFQEGGGDWTVFLDYAGVRRAKYFCFRPIFDRLAARESSRA